jgi:glycosyltransferase involved in cell wall biosynthesis
MNLETDLQTADQQPLVSIIMPSHNAGRFIAESIESVLAQTYTNWELLVIDDASTDDTEAIVNKLMVNEPRIAYHKMERLGFPSRVRNVGLRLAKGEFISFLDSDDMYYPETLATQLSGFKKLPEATAVYGFPSYMNEHGDYLPQGVRLDQQPDGSFKLPSYYMHSWQFILSGFISVMLPSLMVKKETLERVGLFNEDIFAVEDYQFFLRLLLDGQVPEGIDAGPELEHATNRVKALPHYMYRYRVYSGGITKTEEHFQRIVNHTILMFEDLYGDCKHAGPLPASAMQWRSLSFTHLHRYHARERLLHHQPAIARALIQRAKENPNVLRKDWMKLCFPLLVRSYIPGKLNDLLVSCRWRLRKLLVSKG